MKLQRENPEWAKSLIEWGWRQVWTLVLLQSEILVVPQLPLQTEVLYALKPKYAVQSAAARVERSKIIAKTNNVKSDIDSRLQRAKARAKVKRLPRLKPKIIKKRYSPLETYDLLKSHEPPGLREKYDYTEDDVYKLAALSVYEASGRPVLLALVFKAWAIIHLGLWQINMRPKFREERLRALKKYGVNKLSDLYDPDINAKSAWHFFEDGLRRIK